MAEPTRDCLASSAVWHIRQSDAGECVDDQPFLSGIPVNHVLDRLAKAGGKEIESGKFSSPESSAALAVNCFGWFIERPRQLPPLKGLEDTGIPELVDIEFCARFPWAGGRHPWLDAVVQTPRCLIGIESKRFEPFRDVKLVSLSDAYDRPVWGANMKGYERMRDRLRSGDVRYVHLDAAQLVKHAFGLVTEGGRRNRAPALFYLFAEPAARGSLAIAPDNLARHRDEIASFAAAVAGDAVTFHSASYREWLGTWSLLDSRIAAHGQAIIEAFEP
ncbi:PGN_0703 family putative restriction endonuclease [Burkholderia sp. Bp9143]|uniref:PGN_0703 family putative restriction endonuclease n=1 Tax=Burkholderia sp. Bp9143 TaxID=2184574 RepID=UPI000F5B0745|nr:hypothetical protein [Burkholderia sp. Bp9143]